MKARNFLLSSILVLGVCALHAGAASADQFCSVAPKHPDCNVTCQFGCGVTWDHNQCSRYCRKGSASGPLVPVGPGGLPRVVVAPTPVKPVPVKPAPTPVKPTSRCSNPFGDCTISIPR